MPKATKKKGMQRHDPLDKQIKDASSIEVKSKKKKTKFQEQEDEDEHYIDPKLSKKILHAARSQQSEMEREDKKAKSRSMGRQAPTFQFGNESEDDLDYDENDVEELEEVELDAEDEAALAAFMPQDHQPRQTIADLIMEKIREKEEGVMTTEDPQEALENTLDPKLVQVYQGVGKLLSRYKSGKLPKAFKIVPRLANWEEVLVLTSPDKWSPQAMSAATKMFASQLNPKMAQRFYNLVLLPAVRNDIQNNDRLNYHYFMALKKSVYKPHAFYKGLVIPLCEGGCTLREAHIFASVMAKISIPVEHSAAALLYIAEMEYSAPNSLFVRVLVDKKYALPYRVLDALVAHFVRMTGETRELPVMWHQSILAFVQRYKTDLSDEGREALKMLVKRHQHPAITPEIHRELQAGAAGAQEADMEDANVDMME